MQQKNLPRLHFFEMICKTIFLHLWIFYISIILRNQFSCIPHVLFFKDIQLLICKCFTNTCSRTQLSFCIRELFSSEPVGLSFILILTTGPCSSPGAVTEINENFFCSRSLQSVPCLASVFFCSARNTEYAPAVIKIPSMSERFPETISSVCTPHMQKVDSQTNTPVAGSSYRRAGSALYLKLYSWSEE